MSNARYWPLAAALVLAGCAGLPEHETAGGPDGITRDAQTPSVSVDTPVRDHGLTPRGRAEGVSDPDAAEVTDLWERVRNGYAIPGHDNERVEEQFRAYAGYGDYWMTVSERARPYLHHIVEQLEARDMPQELALLPMVESAYRPFAYSHGRAAGIWQFIPATGRHYGLEQNWWYDGRRDVIAATDAALNYLQHLNELFEGDWLLALAAYNAGQGTVSRAMERNRQAGKPTDYWSLDLPRETMNYVPRLLAISELVADPGAHGVELASIPNEPTVEVVELDQQLDLALAAELAGIDMETLYRLNPGYNRWATGPSGPHRLLLPRDRVAAFRQGLAETPRRGWMRWQRHRIARGETLGEIANRYHVTVAALQEANDVQGHMIRAGDHLLVPMAGRPSGESTLTAGSNRGGSGNRAREGSSRRNYVVRAGDSFWSIAQRFGVGMRELARWNGMAPDETLAIGEQLTVWSDDRAGLATAGGTPGDRLQSVTYSVREGDSLHRIARRFNVSVSDLRRWNGLREGVYLQPGQALRMQVDVTAQSNL
ncbi:LysM peptidoglycan-binding domain-containing protein [Spiribacter onubensis]|uniref:LysM peptidoglycan-binding domain-containing protein n=1 Tax=Spiribacter onubensis TaxID=3122420 RepID=A0ABV3S663_9GAMM